MLMVLTVGLVIAVILTKHKTRELAIMPRSRIIMEKGAESVKDERSNREWKARTVSHRILLPMTLLHAVAPSGVVQPPRPKPEALVGV